MPKGPNKVGDKIIQQVVRGISIKYRVVFFNWASPENVSRLAPPKNASTGPPYFENVLSNAGERGDIPKTLTFSIPMGGQSGTLTFFLNQLLTGQHLANSGEAQLKISPCISVNPSSV